MIDHIDHFVLTTADEKACIAFYVGVLGMREVRYGNSRVAFHFGNQKINVHLPGGTQNLVAHRPAPGTLDFCFIADRPLDEVIAKLNAAGVKIIEGPGTRAGATGPIRSVYMRDPDMNLVEISELQGA